MPADALPIPRPVGLDGTVHYRREYRDALGRPMTGSVTIAGRTRLEQGATVIPPAPVKVELVGGVLDVDLPPDTYTLTATLRTVDGERASDTSTIGGQA